MITCFQQCTAQFIPLFWTTIYDNLNNKHMHQIWKKIMSCITTNHSKISIYNILLAITYTYCLTTFLIFEQINVLNLIQEIIQYVLIFKIQLEVIQPQKLHYTLHHCIIYALFFYWINIVTTVKSANLKALTFFASKISFSNLFMYFHQLLT